MLLAAGKGYVEICRILLDKNADVNAKTEPREEEVEVRDGVSIVMRMPAGWTALMVAVKNGQDETVDLLLEAGANPALTNGQGQTAWDIAEEKGLKSIMKMLKKP